MFNTKQPAYESLRNIVAERTNGVVFWIGSGLSKPFDQVRKEDIEALVDNEVKEGRTIEYKQELPGGKDGDKKEFLADASSFANASGGDLLYGVVEKRDADGKTAGVPERAAGLKDLNADVAIRRLDSMVQTGIGPRIAGVRIRPVEGFPDGPVLLVRVPKSYAAPHMVTFQEHSRFYSRNNGGKYAMDVGEIRTAFALSESLPERVRRFRDGRLALIGNDGIPHPLRRGPTVVLHVVPFTSLDLTTRVDVAPFEGAEHNFLLAPMGMQPWETRFNLDGLFLHRTDPTTRSCEGYVQLFRNGILESVNASIVEPTAVEKVLPIDALQYHLVHQLGHYLRAQHELGLEPPTVVLLTLLGVRGWVLPQRGHVRAAIDRDTALLPDVFVENYPTPVPTVLRPALDALWQSGGVAPLPALRRDRRVYPREAVDGLPVLGRHFKETLSGGVNEEAEMKQPWEWTEDDLLALVANGTKESVTLDYKECDGLARTDGKKKDVSKDVSALANSAGGTIVYGVVENGHVPVGLDKGFDPSDITKEWLEQVINSNIQRRIDGVRVNQVELAKTHPGRVAYVVHVPQSMRAPHQASDWRYYKRFNFASVPMEDYEVRDVARRDEAPDLRLDFKLYMDTYANFMVEVTNEAAAPAEHAVITIYIDARLIHGRIDRKRASGPLETVTLTADGRECPCAAYRAIWGPARQTPLFRGVRLSLVERPFAFRVSGDGKYLLTYRLQAPHMAEKSGHSWFVSGEGEHKLVEPSEGA